MDLHDQYGLTRVVNARGPFTPLGVSRTDRGVAAAVAKALGGFFVMDELQALAGRELAAATGAEAGTVVHCTASAITLAVAATMTGESAERVAALPDTGGMPARVVLPAGHAVDYGQPLVQAVRLSGATAVLAGTDEKCTTEDLAGALAHPETACLLLVSSRLTRGAGICFADAVAAAHRRGVPVVVDGAAQVLRVRELLSTGADLVLVSGQKYLASPTAGLVLGRAALVRAVRAQEKGIGRGMKATKEAIAGVLAALRLSREENAEDPGAWREQAERVARFVERADGLPGTAAAAPDPTGLPFPRVSLRVDASRTGMDAKALAAALRTGSPQIWVSDQYADRGELLLELVPLTEAEVELILVRLTSLLAG